MSKEKTDVFDDDKTDVNKVKPSGSKSSEVSNKMPVKRSSTLILNEDESDKGTKKAKVDTGLASIFEEKVFLINEGVSKADKLKRYILA